MMPEERRRPGEGPCLYFRSQGAPTPLTTSPRTEIWGWGMTGSLTQLAEEQGYTTAADRQ